MKKAKSVVLLLLCAVLLVSASVAGTLAYLKVTTDPVTNTFTVGNVSITLTEAKLDVQTGEKLTGAAAADVTEMQDIELVPGRTIHKNPKITVGATSEDCYLFVKVENGLEGAGELIWDANWAEISGADGYYQYATKVSKNAVIDVFTAFECDETLDNTTIAAFEDKQIVITAYAIQAEGFDTIADAWAEVQP